MTTRDKLHEIIFEADTPTGKVFDVVLLLLCASLCGAWTPVPGRPAEPEPRREPVPTVG